MEIVKSPFGSELVMNGVGQNATKVAIPIKQDGNCYVTKKGINTDGYAKITLDGKCVLLHRLVYTMTKGEIPKGMIVRHLCNNRACLNPEHLAVGTHADNVRDRVLSDRSARGVNHGRAKLTEAKARAILKATHEDPTVLAKRYDVSRGTIRLIQKGINWKHLTVNGFEAESAKTFEQRIEHLEKRVAELEMLVLTRQPYLGVAE